MTRRPLRLAPLAALLVASTLAAQERGRPTTARIPLVTGLAIGHVEHGVGGERESVTTVEEATPAGARYGWRFRELHANGDTVVGEGRRFVRAADHAGAARVHLIYDHRGPVEHPGYTAWSVSAAVYRQLVADGRAPFQIMSGEPAAGAGARAGLGLSPSASQLVPVRWRGTLARASGAPEPFPLLLNGHRVRVPALRVRAELVGRGKRWTPELWVLDDGAHPLLLRVESRDPPKRYQVVRVDLPDERAAARGAIGGRAAAMERTLATACRVELPGVYFAFGSAALDPISDRALASVAAILERHRDWRLVIEGHTDSIGGDAPNRTLSEQRAAAVRERLVSAHRIAAVRLRAVGHGAARPREPNGTTEGRARNRRVELARSCGDSTP